MRTGENRLMAVPLTCCSAATAGTLRPACTAMAVCAGMNRLLGMLPLLVSTPKAAENSGATTTAPWPSASNMPRAKAWEMPAAARISAIMANRKTVITAWRPVVQAARASLGSRAAWPRSGGQHAGRDQPGAGVQQRRPGRQIGVGATRPTAARAARHSGTRRVSASAAISAA